MDWVLIGVLAVLTALFVLYPLLQRTTAYYDWDGTGEAARRAGRMREIEGEVQRYREALRSGTLCRHCQQANPSGSRFCGDCGRPLRNTRTEAISVQVPST